MKALLMLVLVVVIIGVGLKWADVPLPFIDYAVGPLGEGRGPAMTDVQVQPPGFDDFPEP